MIGRTLWVVACLGVGLLARSATAQPATTEQVEAFRARCSALATAASAADRRAVLGRDGWMFFAAELRHLGVGRFWGDAAVKVSRARRAAYADPLPAILDFKKQLDALGIEFIFLPVPPKAVVYPDRLPGKLMSEGGAAPRLDAAHQAFYAKLAEAGVQVLDLTPHLMAHRLDEAGSVYCRQDTHWSGRACVLAAQILAKHLKHRPWLKDIPRRKFVAEMRKVEITGNLLTAEQAKAVKKERLPLRFVWPEGREWTTPIESDRDSPILLLSDSHGLVFHEGGDLHTKGAGLTDQLAFELGFAVDILAARGSATMPVRKDLYRRGRRDKDYLKRKKVIIWCLAARDFTESTSGWPKMPVAKKMD